jgi:formyltetrahydrofolate synthetase
MRRQNAVFAVARPEAGSAGRAVSFSPWRNIKLSAGAGFIVVLAGDMMTMPGLPKNPAAEQITIDDEGRIEGLF